MSNHQILVVMKRKITHEEKNGKISGKSIESEEDNLMTDNDPEWNPEVAKFSQSYACYSFEKEGSEEDQAIMQPPTEAHEIWY